jgi:hypothetical protein
LQLAQSLQGGTPWSVRTGLAWLITGEVQMRTDPTAVHASFVAAVDHLGHNVVATHPALKRAQALADKTVAASGK